MGMLFRRRRPIARLAVGAVAAGVAPGPGHRRDEPDGDDPRAPSRYVAPPPVSTGGEVDELSRLVQMHDSGALSDDEFTAAKAQLLGL